MALLATYFYMRSGQREIRVVVVEVCAVPIRGVVAQSTVVRILLCNVILGIVVVVLMARPAIRRGTVIAARVAGLTIHLHVRASQREIRVVVVEVRVFPICRVVA